MAQIVFLSESDVQSVLRWDTLLPSIEQAMLDVSLSTAESVTIQPARGIMPIPHKKGFLLTMPGLSERKKVLSCKLVTAFLRNQEVGLPSIMATIAVFNSDTGKLEAIVEGTAITEWRTAAASVIATKHLKPELQNNVLAVLGAGRQARIHIIALQHAFAFKKVNLWNRTSEKAEKLAEELKQAHNIDVEVVADIRSATKLADVVVTATYASEPVVRVADLKPGVVINAIGAGATHHSELHPDVYQKSVIFTDSMDNARVELKGLIEKGYRVLGEVGEVIGGRKQVPECEITIFHSLGMAVEDAVSAKLVLDDYLMLDKVGKEVK